MLVETRDAVFGYGKRPVVQVSELRLDTGRCLGIFGPNGSGKTTLVRGITGLLAPMSGSVTRRAELRVGYLPQHRTLDLHWPMTALDAASMAVSARARAGWVSHRRRNIVLAMMRRLGVETLTRRSFAKLSGGQQQRVLLAGAMASDPQLLVLDEPTDGLDVHSRHSLLAVLRELAVDGLATVIISHDVEDLMYLSHEVARVQPADEEGHPSQIELTQPTALAERLLVASHHGGAA
jgi:ABC-type Mn2+/Zn2+ transport system ATPase subunit